MRLFTCVHGALEQAALLNKAGRAVLASDIWHKPLSMLELIRLCASGGALPAEEDLARFPSHEMSGLRLRAPIPHPIRNLFCLGKNYADHVREMGTTIFAGAPAGAEVPAHPVFFSKSAFSVIGPDDEIPCHAHFTSQIDYEAELAVIIGQTASRVPERDAGQYIFGYTCANDISARDIQDRHGQWFLGKSLDGFAPMGPFLVTADELGCPPVCDVSARVGGEVRQHAHSGDMLFSVPAVISLLSQAITLHPGDIILTGTPAGVGHGMKPPRYLRTGDVVEVDISGIGVLRNTMGA